MSASYCLTRRFFYDIVDGRMEEHRLFVFMLTKRISGWRVEDRITKKNGGGSCAYKNYTGMHRMQAAQLQHDQG